MERYLLSPQGASLDLVTSPFNVITSEIQIYGMITDPGTFHLERFYVPDAERRNGAGSTLLKILIEMLRERGVRTITLHVHTSHPKDHTPTLQFFLNRGFVLEGENRSGSPVLRMDLY